MYTHGWPAICKTLFPNGSNYMIEAQSQQVNNFVKAPDHARQNNTPGTKQMAAKMVLGHSPLLWPHNGMSDQVCSKLSIDPGESYNTWRNEIRVIRWEYETAGTVNKSPEPAAGYYKIAGTRTLV